MVARPQATVLVCLFAFTFSAACGPGSDAAGEAETQAAATPTQPQADVEGCEGAEGLADVVAELDGLDADARRSRLNALAEEEGASVDVYGSTNYTTMSPVFDLFQEDTGVSVSYYRAASPTVLTRLLQEAEAGSSEADVVIINGVEMVALVEEDLALDVETPIAEQLIPSAVNDSWYGFYVIAYTAGWNTDLITEPPTSWEQVLTGYPGQLALQAGDWDWFGTLVEDYFIAEQGLTEEEAVDMFREAARNASLVVSGHTLMAQFLAAGEYGLAAPNYAVNHRRMKAEGAPVEWEPPVEPLVLRTDGIAIHRDTCSPATALLMLEFLLTDAQAILPETGRMPANSSVEGGLPAEYETLPLPVDVIQERDKWEPLYEEVIREAGMEPVDS